MLDKAIAPKIGRTPFPAFLKNCLLFRSSSSFLFFPSSFMTLSIIAAIRIPDFANFKTLINEKTWESALAYPTFWLSHCLLTG